MEEMRSDADASHQVFARAHRRQEVRSVQKRGAGEGGASEASSG